MNWPGIGALEWRVSEAFGKLDNSSIELRERRKGWCWAFIIIGFENPNRIAIRATIRAKKGKTSATTYRFPKAFDVLAEAKAACEAWLTNHYGEAPSEGREVTE